MRCSTRPCDNVHRDSLRSIAIDDALKNFDALALKIMAR
jgi:hypothetical protein